MHDTTLGGHKARIRMTLSVLIASALLVASLPTRALALTPQILFPVLGGGAYSNDFSGARANGTHGATDIFAKKHTPLLAAVDGYVSYVAYPEPSYGWIIQLTDDAGYTYNYIHINNDTPGTDNGYGGAMNAYAADMKRNNRVNKGQVIGYMGDSGNAENTPPHLHFEIFGPSDNLINPYEHLRAAPIVYSVNPSDYVIQQDEFLPYTMNRLRVNVAVADVVADSGAEIISAAGAPGGPHVKIFNASNNTYTGLNFFAYASGFTGGVNVAAGDVDGDGKAEIITGAGPGGGPHVRVFKANGQAIADFFPYPGFTGGVNVAAGDVDGDTKAEIITAAGPGAGPHVRVLAYDATAQGDKLTAIRDFAAYPDGFHSGVKVSIADTIKNGQNSKSEILTVPAYEGKPEVRVFGQNSQLLKSDTFIEHWWLGGYSVAGSNDGKIIIGMGDQNRRGSIKLLPSY